MYFPKSNYSVEIRVLGANVACSRNIRAHTFYTSGSIRINHMETGINKRFVMNFKKNVKRGVYLNKNCRDYPNEDFYSYK